MTTLFTGRLRVDYAQFYVESRTDEWAADLTASLAGQSNGLCGAAAPGFLFLTTGMHVGSVALTVERHEGEPALDESWEEIVEASFTPASETIKLCEWGGTSWPVELPLTSLRVRYCARGMAEAAQEGVDEDEPAIDHYLLQFWPAPAAPDAVLKQTTAIAATRHGWARETVPPPPPPTPEELAELQRQKRLEEHEAHLRYLASEWGGRLPSDRLLNLGDAGRGLVRADAELVHALDAADPALQRTVARWAARRVYERAGLSDVQWIAPALSALDRGEPLPPPFDQPDRAWERLIADPHVPDTTMLGMDGRSGPCHQQSFALPALRHAADPDPLRAALAATFDACAGYGIDYPELLAELRRTFPELFG